MKGSKMSISKQMRKESTRNKRKKEKSNRIRKVENE